MLCVIGAGLPLRRMLFAHRGTHTVSPVHEAGLTCCPAQTTMRHPGRSVHRPKGPKIRRPRSSAPGTIRPRCHETPSVARSGPNGPRRGNRDGQGPQALTAPYRAPVSGQGLATACPSRLVLVQAPVVARGLASRGSTPLRRFSASARRHGGLTVADSARLGCSSGTDRSSHGSPANGIGHSALPARDGPAHPTPPHVVR